MVDDLEGAILEFEGKLEAAQMRLDDARQALVQAHLQEGDVQRANADVIAATADLQALQQAYETLQRRLAEARQLERKELLQARTKEIGKQSKAYKTRLQKAEEHFTLAMAEMAHASKLLLEIRKLADLPELGDAPEEWSRLVRDLKDPSPSVAVAAAALIAKHDRIFAQHLGRALSNHKTASMQCAGRTMMEMGISPIDYVAA